MLILALQEEFCLGCCPFGVCRNCKTSNGVQDLSDAQKALLQAEGLPVDSPDQALMFFEEDDGHFAAQGLAFVDPVFFPTQGLVFCDVQDHRRLTGDLVHEALLEHRLDVVSPSHRKGAARAMWCSRSIRLIILQEISKCS